MSDALTELYNSHSFEDRKNKLGLGYVSAQITTIKQIRELNKKAWQAHDRKLAAWQKNCEESAVKDFLTAQEGSNDVQSN